MSILAVVLVGLGGVFNAVMDVLQFKYHKSVFDKLNAKFWDPAISWMNK